MINIKCNGAHRSKVRDENFANFVLRTSKICLFLGPCFAVFWTRRLEPCEPLSDSQVTSYDVKKLSRKSTVRKIWVLEKKLQIWISKLKKFFHDCTACHKFTRPDICLLCLTIQVLYTCKIFLRFLYNSTCNGQKQFSEFTSGRSQNAKKWDKRSHYPRSRRRRSMKFWGYKIPVESHTDTKNGENPYTNTRAACKQT